MRDCPLLKEPPTNTKDFNSTTKENQPNDDKRKIKQNKKNDIQLAFIRKGRCEHCNRIGHISEECWRKAGACLCCGNHNHRIFECPILKEQEKEKCPTGQKKPDRLQAAQKIETTKEDGVMEGKSDDDLTHTNGNGLENTSNNTAELLPFGRPKGRKLASCHHLLTRLHHRRDLNTSLGIASIDPVVYLFLKNLTSSVSGDGFPFFSFSFQCLFIQAHSQVCHSISDPHPHSFSHHSCTNSHSNSSLYLSTLCPTHTPTQPESISRSEMEGLVRRLLAEYLSLSKLHSLQNYCKLPNAYFPLSFRTPKYRKYDGTSDPQFHLAGFLMDSHRWLYDRVLMVHLFQQLLEGEALRWLTSLHASDFINFDIVSKRFISHFSYMATQVPTLPDLAVEKMRPDEDFVTFANR
ncbi:hypothetical protein Taro_024223 [Colocasia esculenta]|uniref:CCHC-type domain-containing protein n=1 Tax=Colocasia esculenta TaxID=4460 RepID=A0A843V5U1_COLES|nr:hypothetical protein [Colocasia esculenta]